MDTLLIGDFARLSGVSVHTLRHWHEVGLLIPAAVNPVSGYRRYHADQLGPARLVQSLREADVSVLLIRQMLQAAHRDELKDTLRLLIQQSRMRVRGQAAIIQAFTVIAEHLDQMPATLPSGWMTDLPPLPVSKLRVAFVGIPGGIGRTPSAISTAAMLCALGRDVVVVEVSPYGYGALQWADVARGRGDPLPFRVLPMRDFATVAAHQDVVFDSSSRHEDFLTAATLANRVVLCTRAADNLDFTLRHELPLLGAAGVDVHGPNFGILVTGMPDGDPERSSEDELEWLEERRSWQALFTNWLVDLGGRGLPVLGVIPYREVHQLATMSRPRDFDDHHRVLGRFLGVSHLQPPPVSADYLEQLRTQRLSFTELLQILPS